jgi:hypothetical protein
MACGNKTAKNGEMGLTYTTCQVVPRTNLAVILVRTVLDVKTSHPRYQDFYLQRKMLESLSLLTISDHTGSHLNDDLGFTRKNVPLGNIFCSGAGWFIVRAKRIRKRWS